MMAESFETTTSELVDAHGVRLSRPTRILTQEEAELLRRYKQFLERQGLREMLFCNDCWDGQLDDGCKAHVTSAQILIECRCRLRFHQA